MECFNKPADAFLSGRKFAQAYAAYAKSAQSCALVPPLGAAIDAAALKLGGLIGQAYHVSKDPVTTASLMATAFAGFWMAPPIPFPSAAPGVVTIALPATLQAALLSNFVQGPCNAKDAARKMAVALDTWTKSVTVTHGPVPACIAGLV